MECRNHPGVSATGRCAGCSEAFCDSCLVEIQGQKYCGSCKVMAVKAAPAVEQAMIPCTEADEALKYALVGIFCFGIILEPIAISKALKARKMIAANPRLAGAGKATFALVLGFVLFGLWLVGIIAQIAGQGNM